MSDPRDTALASLICERNDHPDAPACDGCYAMAAHLRENGYAAPPSDPAAPLDVERLARALEQAWRAQPWPTVGEQPDFDIDLAAAIAREYAALALLEPDR